MNRVWIIIFIVFIFILSIPALAQQQFSEDDLKQINQDIEEILTSPDFDTWEEQQVWKWKWQQEDTDTSNETDIQINEQTTGLLVQIARVIAAILPWLLITALVFILSIIIIMKRKKIIDLFRSRSIKNKKEQTIYLDGEKIIGNLLPSRIVQKARQLWQSGQHKGAISLLYRGAIAHFSKKMHISIPDSATERECFTLVNSQLHEQISFRNLLTYFSSLIRTWLFSAYANRHPDNSDFNYLCDTWDKFLRNQEQEE